MIHNLAAYGVDPRELTARLLVEKDPAARALIVSLGEYAPASVPDELRRIVVERLCALHVSDGDPGTHSAIEWLLCRQWDLERELDRVAAMREPAAEKQWFLNTNEMTMAVISVAKPLEFEIGSPEDEDGRDSDERLHRSSSIGRSRSQPARSPCTSSSAISNPAPVRTAPVV